MMTSLILFDQGADYSESFTINFSPPMVCVKRERYSAQNYFKTMDVFKNPQLD